MQISLSICTAYKETATENEQFTNTVKVKYKETSEDLKKFRIINFLIMECCRYLVL